MWPVRQGRTGLPAPDADGSQRLAVEAAQRVGRLASPDRAQRFRLDAFRRDTLVAQDRAGRFVGRGRAKQQVLVLTQRFVSIC